jgi:hypothetical protein
LISSQFAGNPHGNVLDSQVLQCGFMQSASISLQYAGNPFTFRIIPSLRFKYPHRDIAHTFARSEGVFVSAILFLSTV